MSRGQRFEQIASLQTHPRTWDNYIGKCFGRLTVLGYAGEKTAHGQKLTACRCACGFYVHVMLHSVVSGSTKSCGCLHSEQVATRNLSNVTHGHASGGSVTPEYRAWQAMLNRCLNPNDPRYPDYGGVGIGVCERWQASFQTFLDDMGLKPSPKHSLDNIDNKSDYGPGNCRWATPTEQNRNQTTTRRYTIGDVTLTLPEWAERVGIAPETVAQRMRRGLPLEEALQPRLPRPLSRKHLRGRWTQIIQRCHNPQHERYADYGGRGIVVCDAWRVFEAFEAAVGYPPNDSYSLDRINNDKGYEPGNVRWTTFTKQNRNRRNITEYELAGETLTLAEWAERAQMPYQIVKARITTYGWSLDEALGTPVGGLGRTPNSARRKWTRL